MTDTDLCDCGHPECDHMVSLPDANGFFFITCDYCDCLEASSEFDV